MTRYSTFSRGWKHSLYLKLWALYHKWWQVGSFLGRAIAPIEREILKSMGGSKRACVVVLDLPVICDTSVCSREFTVLLGTRYVTNCSIVRNAWHQIGQVFASISSQFQAVKLLLKCISINSITDNISVSASVRQQYLKINQRTYLFHTPASRQGGAYETQSLLRGERYPH
jgi:hypothetical protein